MTGMDAMGAVKATLKGISDDELGGLIDATNKVPKTARGTPAWIDAACSWELSRRHSVDYELWLPDAVVGSHAGGNALSVGAAFAVRTAYIAEARSAAPRNVLALFDALAHLLSGGRPQ